MEGKVGWEICFYIHTIMQSFSWVRFPLKPWKVDSCGNPSRVYGLQFTDIHSVKNVVDIVEILQRVGIQEKISDKDGLIFSFSRKATENVDYDVFSCSTYEGALRFIGQFNALH